MRNVARLMVAVGGARQRSVAWLHVGLPALQCFSLRIKKLRVEWRPPAADAALCWPVSMLPVCAFYLLPCYCARGSGAVGICRATFFAVVSERLAETHAGLLLLDAVLVASSTSTDGVEPTPSIVNFSAQRQYSNAAAV